MHKKTKEAFDVLKLLMSAKQCFTPLEVKEILNLDQVERRVKDILDGLVEYFGEDIIKKDFNRYLGKIFEDVCKNIIKDNFVEIGSWWHKDKEIDIIAYDDSKLVFGECKWKDNVNPEKICKELIEKIQYVEIPNNIENHKKNFGSLLNRLKAKLINTKITKLDVLI